MPFFAAQAVIGCMIARSITPEIVGMVIRGWPLFLTADFSVIAASSVIGLLLTRWRVLPGTTAVWGSCPGAAPAMTLMAEAFGADVRLVATRPILAHAMRALPRVAASILVLLAICGGGADSVAIIAASSNVDVPFVMALQTLRFLVVLFAGPSLSRFIARWTSASDVVP